MTKSEFTHLLSIHPDDVREKFPNATDEQAQKIVEGVKRCAGKNDSLYEVFWEMIQQCGEDVIK